MGNIRSRNFNPSTDLLDLKGKVAIVTGGNTGIGLETVRFLARAGAKVYLAARNESRATGALADLDHKGLGPGNGEVLWLKLDLTDPRDVKKAAEEFLAKEKRLDILVNNAAVISEPHNVGPYGVAAQATVNYIGPYVFTRTLLPLLGQTARQSGSDVRIVNVSSIAHKLIPTPTKFETKEDFNLTYPGRPLSDLTRYGLGKFMMILWTKTLQRRLNADPSEPITVISIHPGGVDTFSQRWPWPRLSKFLIRLVIAGPEVGAYNSVFAAAGKRVADNRKKYEGAYLESQPTGKFASPHKAALDENLGEQLWNTTEAFLAELGV